MSTVNPQDLRFAVLSIDVVVLTIIKGEVHVLVIKPTGGPFQGTWALPGGLVRPEESLEQAAMRHLITKTGLRDIYIEQLYTFGRVDRDPRGRVVSVAYFALLPSANAQLKTSEDYEDIKWMPLSQVDALAYDHSEILDTAMKRLKAKLEYTNIVYSLLPEEFTLTELQKIYEIILGRDLDKRNFRRKILSLGLIESSANKRTGMANRPAQLYKFVSKEYQVVEVL